MKGHTISNTSAIIDFDRTVTKGSYTNPNSPNRIDFTSFSVLRNSNNIDKKLFEKTQALYDYYIQRERDPNLDAETKAQDMLDWPMKVYELYYRYLNEDLFYDALDNSMQQLQLRDGMRDFLNFLGEKNIPTLIFSGGISNVISHIIQYHDLNSSIKVFGNTIHFDNNGRFIIPNRSDIIHTENKSWSSLPPEITADFQNRTHMIVMGDSPGDIHMGDTSGKQMHRVGFLLESNQDPQGFRGLYDETIKSEECDLARLSQIANKLKVD